MATTNDAGGPWLVASDSSVFYLGDASFYGSTGGLRLNFPITGMVAHSGQQGLLAGGQ